MLIFLRVILLGVIIEASCGVSVPFLVKYDVYKNYVLHSLLCKDLINSLLIFKIFTGKGLVRCLHIESISD
jgi:hypothetical protein